MTGLTSLEAVSRYMGRITGHAAFSGLANVGDNKSLRPSKNVLGRRSIVAEQPFCFLSMVVKPRPLRVQTALVALLVVHVQNCC
jgi:hypothetical protein